MILHAIFCAGVLPLVDRAKMEELYVWQLWRSSNPKEEELIRQLSELKIEDNDVMTEFVRVQDIYANFPHNVTKVK